jgi:hypothetical protein
MTISYRYNDTKFARSYVFLERCGHENLEHARIYRNGMALKSKKVMYKTLTELWKFIVWLLRQWPSVDLIIHAEAL